MRTKFASPSNPEAEIDGGREPELGGGRDGQHGRSSNPRRTATISSGRASAGNRTTAPDGRASSIGVAGRDGCDAEWDHDRAARRARSGLGEASPPQVEVGLGDALGGAERGDGLLAGRESFEAFDPLPGGGRVRTGASGTSRARWHPPRKETDAIHHKPPVNHVIRRAHT